MACLEGGLQKEVALLKLHDSPQALCLQPGVPPALVICVLVHICISEEGPSLTAVSHHEKLSAEEDEQSIMSNKYGCMEIWNLCHLLMGILGR